MSLAVACHLPEAPGPMSFHGRAPGTDIRRQAGFILLEASQMQKTPPFSGGALDQTSMWIEL